MKTKLISLLSITLLLVVLSCSDDDEPKADPREPFIGNWEGECAYSCPDILVEDRGIEFTFSKGVNEGDLLVDIELRFALNDPDAVSVAENILATATDDGFQIDGQTIPFNTSEIYISGEGIIKNDELEFSLNIPLSIATCDLTGTIPRD
jgi:hypothetical protein